VGGGEHSQTESHHIDRTVAVSVMHLRRIFHWRSSHKTLLLVNERRVIDFVTEANSINILKALVLFATFQGRILVDSSF